MSFVSYFDESGTHDASDAVTVAGYLATSSMWEQFDDLWRQELNHWGNRYQRQIPYFHMTDFAVGAPPFNGWDESDRTECLSQLIKIIHANTVGSIGITIPTSFFQATFNDAASRFVGGPYGLAALMCFIEAAGILENTGVHGKVAYVFESGAKGAGQILKVFQDNVRSPGNREHLRLLSLKFEDKRDFTPLQAADMLAYEMYRQMPKTLGLDTRPPRLSLAALSNAPKIWGYVNQAELEKWSRIIRLRLGLSEKDLEWMPDNTKSLGAQIAISLEEFQQRWIWWDKFSAARGQRMETR